MEFYALSKMRIRRKKQYGTFRVSKGFQKLETSEQEMLA